MNELLPPILAVALCNSTYARSAFPPFTPFIYALLPLRFIPSPTDYTKPAALPDIVHRYILTHNVQSVAGQPPLRTVPTHTYRA